MGSHWAWCGFPAVAAGADSGRNTIPDCCCGLSALLQLLISYAIFPSLYAAIALPVCVVVWVFLLLMLLWLLPLCSRILQQSCRHWQLVKQCCSFDAARCVGGRCYRGVLLDVVCQKFLVGLALLIGCFGCMGTWKGGCLAHNPCCGRVVFDASLS